MQATSDLYKSILANPRHLKQHRVFIAGTEYGHGQILSKVETVHTNLEQKPMITGSLFSKGKLVVGCCVSRQLDLMVIPRGFIPRMAEIRVETRLILKDPLSGVNTAESEWLPKGTFFVDTRKKDHATGALTIHGYDAMLKTERRYLAAGDTGEWPRAMRTVVEDIAARIGVRLDSRTVIIDTFPVPYPNDYTMREILGYIAAAHAGNWIITDAGELRLVGFADIPPETFYLVTDYGDPIVFGDTRILV